MVYFWQLLISVSKSFRTFSYLYYLHFSFQILKWILKVLHKNVTRKRWWHTRSCHNPKIKRANLWFNTKVVTWSHKCLLNRGMLLIIINITITRVTQTRTKHRFRVIYTSMSLPAFLWVFYRSLNIWQIIFIVGFCLKKICLLM